MIRFKSTGEMSNLVLIAVLFRCFLVINSVVGAPIRSLDSHDYKTTATNSEAASSGEYRVEKFILPDGYDKTQPLPLTTQVINSSGQGDIGRVTAHLYFIILSVEMNEAKQEILLEALTMLAWRTESNTGIPSNSSSDSVEPQPSLIQNELSFESLLVEKWVRLNGSDGTSVVYRRGVSRLKCPLDFTYFPADTQKCIVKFWNNNYENKFKCVWGDLGFVGHISADNHAVAIDNKQRFRVGGQEYLQFSIKFRRKVSYHLLQTYIPSMLYVMITGLCFFIPKRVELRIGVTMTTLLTLTSMFSSVRQIPPIVNYVKAIDVWMCACIAFVFVVLLEFILLLWVEAGKLDEEERAIRPLPVINELAKKGGKFRCSCNPRKGKWLTRICGGVIGFIEDHSFLVMLTVLGILNGVYWSWLLTYSGYFEWRPFDPTVIHPWFEAVEISKIYLQDTES